MKLGLNSRSRLKQKWQVIVEDQKQSGLTVNEYCLQNKVAKSSFYHWQKSFKNTDKSVTVKKQEIVTPKLQAPQFIKLNKEQPFKQKTLQVKEETFVIIELPNQVRINLGVTLSSPEARAYIKSLCGISLSEEVLDA